MATRYNYMASFSRGSDEDYSLVCSPCHRDDTNIPAFGYCTECKEHLCHACYKHHKKATLSRHHILQDKDTMPSTQQLTVTSAHAGTTAKLTTPCPRHQTEMIKFYCHDHKVLLCCKCVALEHSKHCHVNVNYIPELSDKMINNRDYKDTMDGIDELLKKCTSIKTDTSRTTKQSNDSLHSALLEIKKYRQEINQRIDELQKEIETRIQDIQHQNDEQVKTVEIICEDVMKMVKITYDNLKQLNESNQADQVFMEVKQAQKQLHEYENCISLLATEVSIDTYKFHPSQAIHDVLQKEAMIGDISTKQHAKTDYSSQFHLLSRSPYDNITPICLDKICVETSIDRCTCYISGMTALPPDRLVLADWKNNSIKLVDVNNKSTTSQISLGAAFVDRAWDITSTASTQVAVTVPGRTHIQLISVSDKLTKTHTIQAVGYCRGICCYQNKLIVTYWFPCKLEVLDMTGKVITRVETDSIGNTLFKKPTCVQANSISIYVSDSNQTAVIILDWQGRMTGRITDIGSPTGLAPLSDGSWIVCDGERNRVWRVSEDGTNTRTMFQYVRRPLAVCVDDVGHKLYISRRTGNEEIANNILVFNI